MKVIIITNIISPYRVPLFNILAQGIDVDLKVIFLAEKEANRNWQILKDKINFEYLILPGVHKFISSKEIPIHINWGLLRELYHYNPDIIITSGYDNIAYWVAYLFCKLFKKKYILWNETTLLSTKKLNSFVGKMKRNIIKGADLYVTFGTKAAEYLVYMGAQKENIHIGVNTVDMDCFRREVIKFRNSATFIEERPKFPKILFLYVGQLIKRKGVFQILNGLSKMNNPDIGLLIVGNGPLEQELKRFCHSQGLTNVFFMGFKQQDELPKYYALADIFILPSFEEVWGLVVNEALASGLYVLCSNKAGAAYDLIREQWNGRIFDPYDENGIVEIIQETVKNVEEIKIRRPLISNHACQEFSIQRSARAFLDAFRRLDE